MRRCAMRALALALAVLFWPQSHAAANDAVETFYKGRTINSVVPFGPGRDKRLQASGRERGPSAVTHETGADGRLQGSGEGEGYACSRRPAPAATVTVRTGE